MESRQLPPPIPTRFFAMLLHAFLLSRSICRSVRQVALIAGLLCAALTFAAEPGKIVVHADQPGARIDPLFYGLMTEEINHSYEGGLYAELIANRIFKNPPPRGRRGGPPPAAAPGAGGGPAAAAPAPGPAPEAPPAIPNWSLMSSDGAQGAISLDTTDPVNAVALTTSLKLEIASVGAGQRVGVANEGYWGIPAFPNATYQASFYAKGSNGFTGPLTVAIESNDGQTVQASGTVRGITNTWQRYHVTLKTGQLIPSATNRFVISAASKGTINLNLVSLFPPVYHERTGPALGGRPVTGFRPDLMRLLADMKPSFLRFPGGNYVEGPNLNDRYNFKITIGRWEDRPGHGGSWGYRTNDGLGLLEFLEWCEELKMEPLLAVWAGLNLNGGNGVVTGDALKPYIQDALDEIEYVSGSTTTEWGARRARDGHPAPFKLTYVEIGNEDNLNNGRTTYRGEGGRFDLFYKAIKAKHPNLQVVATDDPQVKHDVIDRHDYMAPAAAIRNAHKYDKVDRNGPKIFEGEWATQEGGLSNPNRPLTPTLQAAVADAAFLTGLERNADMIIMSCYAPLFTRIEPNGAGNNWKTNLIGYNSLKSYGSPSYYVQKMFAHARGDIVLPVASVTPQTIPTLPPAPPPEPVPAPAPGGRGRGRGNLQPPSVDEPVFAAASKEDATGDIIVKVVNVFDVEQTITVELAGAKVLRKATGQTIAGKLEDTNTLDEPFHTVPKEFAITDASATWNHTFPGNSVTVVRFKTR
jgi:alpha-L-arabinofuranosidase